MNRSSSLFLKADSEERAVFKELLEDDDKPLSDVEAAVLEPLICNSSLDWGYPEDYDDLTTAPMLAIKCNKDSEGEELKTIGRWIYEPYCLRTFVDDLVEKGWTKFIGFSDVTGELGEIDLPCAELRLAVDFDGTLVTHAFPRIGRDIGAVECLRKLHQQGVEIILNTMRSGDYLAEAQKWCEDNDLPLFGINRNPEQDSWTSSPKVYAHMYVDDAALGVPLIVPETLNDRPYVDWQIAGAMLENWANRNSRKVRNDAMLKSWLEA